MSGEVWVILEHIQGKLLDISHTLLAAGRQLAQQRQTQLVALLLSAPGAELPGTLGAADRVERLGHPQLEEFSAAAYLAILTPLLKERSPAAVLIGNTTIGMDYGCALAEALGWPLISAVRSLQLQDGSAGYQSLICGGKLLAEGDIPSGGCLLAMIPGGYRAQDGRESRAPTVVELELSASFEALRMRFCGYRAPDEGDVDISKQPVLVAVGRGLQVRDSLALAEELAQALGGALAASRPLIDQGWLPTTRLVGKSGRSVNPRLYLALGISGAPEHVEGIADCRFVFAVNTDEGAPIYEYASHGAAVDCLELLPVLLERVRQAARV